jgi:hypothetical protein
MPALNRQQILAARDISTRVIEVPEWGGEVRIRGLNGAERVKIAQRSMDANGQVSSENALDLMILIPALCLIDDDDRPMFTEDDVAALSEKNGDVLQRIMSAVLELSDIQLDELKKA